MKQIVLSMIAMAATILFVTESPLYSHYVVVEDDAEGSLTYAVSPDETFDEVIKHISRHLAESGHGHSYDTPSSVNLRILPENIEFALRFAKKARAAPRSYADGVTLNEGADIAYILKTLANQSLPKIKSYESALKRAGDRIDHVHPLQFLKHIFVNEELKVAIRNLQGRSWVWTDFLKGLTDSLAEENGRSNITPFLNEFAVKVNANVSLLIPLQQSGRWDKFVNTLIDTIPRAEGSGRYDQ